MNRRVLLSLAAGIPLAGCLSDDGANGDDGETDQADSDENDETDELNGDANEEIETVSVESEDLVNSETEYELAVRYNSTVQNSVSPDSMGDAGHRSADDEKYVVLRMIVENSGEKSTYVGGPRFEFIADGEVYHFNYPLGEDQIGAEIDRNESEEGWLVTSVPFDVTEGTLKPNIELYSEGVYDENITIRFTEDETIDVDMPKL